MTLTISEIQERIAERIKNEELKPCEDCGVPVKHGICSRCFEARQKARDEELKKQHEQYLANCKIDRYEHYLGCCGIPRLYNNVQSKADNRSLFITGSFGTGKTYYAISILKGFVDQLPNTCFVEPYSSMPLFITVPDLLLKIRSTFSLERCEEEIVDKYANTPLLVLDDLGSEKTTEFSLQTLYIILNRRYNEQLQTVITSNLSLDEVKGMLNDRIASRIAGMCQVVKLNGKDKRCHKN